MHQQAEFRGNLLGQKHGLIALPNLYLQLIISSEMTLLFNLLERGSRVQQNLVAERKQASVDT